MVVKEKIFYFGFSLRFLKELVDSELFEVIGVITQKGKYSQDFENYCNNKKINWWIASNKKELIEYCKTLDISKVIMYEFGIIIPEELCEKNHIVNFHPGNLNNNRGANPISWSVLLPDIGGMMSAYRISPEIDCGELISSREIRVSDDDTFSAVKTKIEDSVKSILEDVWNYFRNSREYNTITIKDGIYRRRICEGDYTIDLENDSIQIIKRKINSQNIYNGAILIVDGYKRYVKSYKKIEDEYYIILDDNTEMKVWRLYDKK